MRRALTLLLAGCAPEPAPPAAPPEPPPTYVLAVLGGVRAERIAPCGGPVPMPAIDGLVARGARLSCKAIAVSPLHTVALKALLAGRAPGVPEGIGPPRRPLPTAAAAQGWRTLLVSAEPDLRGTGIEEGFDLVEIASDDRALRHPGLDTVLRARLPDVGRRKPLLLVVHLRDAADPLPPVPVLPEQPSQGWLALREPDGTRSALAQRWAEGTLAIDEEDRYARRVERGAHQGLVQTDAALATVLTTLTEAGRPPTRLVLVGDAGFLAMEHGQLGADTLPRDAAVRVPLLVQGAGADLPLDRPVSAVLAWDLVQGQPLPGPLPPVVAGTKGRDGRGASIEAWLADGRKLVWRDGVSGLVDPAADPAEAVLLPLPEAPERALFDDLVQRLVGGTK